jgi:hypothetical protein
MTWILGAHVHNKSKYTVLAVYIIIKYAECLLLTSLMEKIYCVMQDIFWNGATNSDWFSKIHIVPILLIIQPLRTNKHL